MNNTTDTYQVTGNRRPCHDWHWIECDRPNCSLDGKRHVRQDEWENPGWFCERHAREVGTR